MTFPSLRFVDVANSALFADLHDDTGTVNAGVRTFLTAIDLGSATETEIFRGSGPGGSVIRHRPDLVEMRVRVVVLPTTPGDYEAVVAFLGKVGKLLAAGGEMDWKAQTTDEIRYIDFEPSPGFAYLRGQDNLADLAQDPEGVEIVILRQPLLRGPEVVLFDANVPANPASAQGMHLTATNPGDAVSPAKLRLDHVSGDNADWVRTASMVFPFPGSSLGSFIAGPLFSQTQAATARGWTVTLGTDTASLTDANASGGTTAQFGGASFASWTERVMLARATANMVPLRGKTFDVWVRMASTVVEDYRIGLLLRSTNPAGLISGPLTAAEATLYRPDSTTAVYTWQKIGRVTFPDKLLGSVQFGIAASAATSAGRLRFDVLALTPTDHSLFRALPVDAGRHLETNPEAGTIDLISDGTENYHPSPQSVEVRGRVPLWLHPGENLVTLFYGLGLSDTPPAPNDRLNTVIKATVTCSPRYLT